MSNLLRLLAQVKAQPPVFPTPTGIPRVSASQNLLTTILTLVFTIAGAIAVLVITIAGFQYVLSQGDPQRTAKAKDSILYAVIGLVVAIAGYSIVNFVVGRVF